MAVVSRTQSVNTTDTTVTVPTKNLGFIRATNLDASNGVWIRVDGTGSAASVAEADENIFLGPGKTRILPYQTQYHMIAITAAVKVLLDSTGTD